MTAPSLAPGKLVEVFFDGECPLCLREIKLLQYLDRKRERIAFTDIATPEFQPAVYDKTMDELMGSIHGRDRNGEWIEGVEVFRQLYSAVGFGWIAKVTALPLVRQFFDWLYGVFARNRLRLTGRPPTVCTTDRCR